jgi:DNA-directed RNA polymerase specialized sigma24 family protein
VDFERSGGTPGGARRSDATGASSIRPSSAWPRVSARGVTPADGVESRVYETAVRVVDRSARRLGLRSADARNVAHDVAVRAAIQFAQYRGDCSLETWVFVIAQHAAVDLRRAHRRETAHRMVLDADALLFDGGFIGQGEFQPERRLVLLEDACAGARAVLALHWRRAFCLLALRGFSVPAAEVAAVLGCRPNLVHQLAHKARVAVRRFLATAEADSVFPAACGRCRGFRATSPAPWAGSACPIPWLLGVGRDGDVGALLAELRAFSAAARSRGKSARC